MADETTVQKDVEKGISIIDNIRGLYYHAGGSRTLLVVLGLVAQFTHWNINAPKIGGVVAHVIAGVGMVLTTIAGLVGLHYVDKYKQEEDSDSTSDPSVQNPTK